MKTLQSDLTTPEQSKRLLELGVPADSANYYYQDYGSIPMVVWTLTQPRDLRRGILKPCWSVGRLMEIAHICSGSNLSYKEEANEIQKFKEEHKCETLIETVIMCIEDAVSISSMDFSKLED